MGGSTLSVALLRQRLVSLLNAMPAAQAGDEDSVHEARVASRRLRGVLPVLGARAGGPVLARARREVRRITRALGPVREIDVSLALLAEFETRGAAPAAAIAGVRHALTVDRAVRRREMLAVLTPSHLERLRRRLVAVAAPNGGFHPGAGEVVESARQTAARARQLRSAIERAGGLYAPGPLHRVRVTAKKLRYGLEVHREITKLRSLAKVNSVKSLQDVLGRIHDVDVLMGRARAVRDALPVADRRGHAHLDTLLRALERDARSAHAVFMQARPAILTLCADLIGAAEPSHPTAVA